MPLGEDSYAPPHVFVEGERESDITVSMDRIDLQALAEEVYDLLRRELRLERERQGWRQGR
jgi:hypothetical protein